MIYWRCWKQSVCNLGYRPFSNSSFLL